MMEDGVRLPGGRTFQDYFNLLLRYLWVIVLTTLAASLYGYYIFSITPKAYQSWASIEVERVRRETTQVDDKGQVQLSANSEIAATLEKLQMPRIYQGVAQSEAFAGRPDVIPAGVQHHWPWASSSKDAAPTVAEKELPATDLAKMMAQWITVRWRNNTNLVDVYAVHTQPSVARDLLQGLLTEYEKLTDEAVSGSEANALDFIISKSSEMKIGMIKSESALNRYNRCMELTLKIREAENEVVQMEKRYLDKWPALVEARQLAKLIREQFSREVENVLSASEEEASFWQENAPGLNGLQGDQLVEARMKLVESRSSILKKELESDRAIFENLITKLKEGQVTKGYVTRQFAIIQPPTLPAEPIAPILSKILVTYVLAGLTTGLALVFMLGLVDNSYRTVPEVESASTVPVAGAIPQFKTVRAKGEKGDLVMLHTKDAPASESIRTLRAGLAYLGAPEERQTFLLTSALASEGKSLLASNLAVAFAQQGDLTVIVDADLRRSVQAVHFNRPAKSYGLSDLLTQAVKFEEACQPAGIPNLWIITGGTRSPNAAELLGSKNLPLLIQILAGRFDRVIIDSAPVLPVADTLSLARLVQTVLLVYRTGKTPRYAFQRALKVLRANRSEPAGIVANLLPRVGKRTYGYYYGGYGGENYGGYSEAKS